MHAEPFRRPNIALRSLFKCPTQPCLLKGDMKNERFPEKVSVSSSLSGMLIGSSDTSEIVIWQFKHLDVGKSADPSGPRRVRTLV